MPEKKAKHNIYIDPNRSAGNLFRIKAKYFSVFIFISLRIFMSILMSVDRAPDGFAAHMRDITNPKRLDCNAFIKS